MADARAAWQACQALFDRYPEAAEPQGSDRCLLLRLAAADGPLDVHRHAFGPEPKVSFRIFPAGQDHVVDVLPAGVFPPGSSEAVTELLATATLAG